MMVRRKANRTMLRLRYTLDGQSRYFPLSGPRVRLGRGSDNDVVLSDVSVSRYHAEIRRDGDGWSIFDLKSTNGVELNRAAVQRAPLQAGDRLSIGVFELVVEPHADVRTQQDVVVTAHPESGTVDLAALTNATIVRPLADFSESFGLLGKLDAPLPAEAPADLAYTNRMFGFLTRLAKVLINVESVDDVLARVLDIAFDALPVDRGFALLSDAGGDLVCELSRIKDRVELRPAEVPVSRTMLRAVMQERVALVTFDAQSDQRLSGGESIRLHQIRAAMCAPLWSGERIIGVMQVDSPFQVGAFTERDLDFLSTLANYVAVAVERIRYARQAEHERQMRSQLERYHSPAVVEQVLHEGGDGSRPRLAQATVLFADLVGFTSFCEKLGA